MAKDIDYFSKEIHTCSYDMEPNTSYKRTWGEIIFDSRNKFDDNLYALSYDLNNYGHRCDNFTNTHNEDHILFAGCSFTFGEGLPYLSNWSGKLYLKLKNKYELSGYYSLGFPNGVTSIIISNIVKYCEKFGMPKILFCLFPDSVRKVDYDGGTLKVSYTHDEKHKALGRLDIYNSINLLERFCYDNKINLMWTTWDKSDLDFFNNCNFKNFLYIDESDILYYASNIEEKNSLFYKMARDNAHPGLRYSDGLANIFMEKANEIFKK